MQEDLLYLTATLLLRIGIGFQPHSGQDNYHGLHSAYGGDFEAQRHWMELTWHRPIGDWYWYDPDYWKLDYPPLSAYVSWVCGWLSEVLVGPHSVALVSSRGIEDPIHKAFMRGTVLVLDLLVYIPACWFVVQRLDRQSSTWFLAVSQPAILLIDHGHFQYNTVALGLSLWGFYFMTKPSARDKVIGSICYCCALSFKQMTLYYAPAVFCYLLGWCMEERKRFLQRFSLLGVTVILSFVALWWPFVYYGPPETTAVERLVHVIRRVIPLERGAFEGKVSNLWCALSVHPFRLRQRLPEDWHPWIALVATLLLCTPACVRVLQRPCSLRDLLRAATTTALAFFLASLQVHEKSILLAVATSLSGWLGLLAAWSLWPLMVLDRLQVAYCLCVWMAGCRPESFRQWMAFCSLLGLHLAEAIYTPPSYWPDLFPVLWSIVGCGWFGVAWLDQVRGLWGDKAKVD